MRSRSFARLPSTSWAARCNRSPSQQLQEKRRPFEAASFLVTSPILRVGGEHRFSYDDLWMIMSDPLIARSVVLRAYHHDQVYLILGSAIAAVGLLPVSFSVLRRRFDPARILVLAVRRAVWHSPGDVAPASAGSWPAGSHSSSSECSRSSGSLYPSPPSCFLGH